RASTAARISRTAAGSIAQTARTVTGLTVSAFLAWILVTGDSARHTPTLTSCALSGAAFLEHRCRRLPTPTFKQKHWWPICVPCLRMRRVTRQPAMRPGAKPYLKVRDGARRATASEALDRD